MGKPNKQAEKLGHSGEVDSCPHPSCVRYRKARQDRVTPPQTFTLEQVEAAVRKAGRIPEVDSPWFDAFRDALTGGGNG